MCKNDWFRCNKSTPGKLILQIVGKKSKHIKLSFLHLLHISFIERRCYSDVKLILLALQWIHAESQQRCITAMVITNVWPLSLVSISYDACINKV